MEKLNRCLVSPLDDADIAYNKRTGLNQKPELLKTFDFDFMPAVQGSPTSQVLVRVKNTSDLTVAFTIKLPNDLEVEVEPWADAGEPTEAELRQNKILDSRLFEISPRKASLEPGETVVLSFSYAYNMLKVRLM